MSNDFKIPAFGKRQTVVFDTSKESFEIYEELSQISEEIEECRSKNC